MKRVIGAFLLAGAFLLSLWGTGSALDNGLVFPVPSASSFANPDRPNEDLYWDSTTDAGSGRHIFDVWGRSSEAFTHFGHNISDYYAVDLNLSRGGSSDEGAPVYAIAEGMVEFVWRDWGYVVIKHTKSITTKSSFVNQYVEGKEWYSGYMHMKNIPSTIQEGVVIGAGVTVGEISDVKSPGQYHLHFAVYDKDMYSFSPWLLGGAFEDIRDLSSGHTNENPTNYRNGNNDTTQYAAASGYYEPNGTGTFISLNPQTGQQQSSSSVANGSLGISEIRGSGGATWLYLIGTINYQDGAWMRFGGEFTFNKKNVGTDGDTTLREWDVNNPNHTHYENGVPYWCPDTRYDLKQIDSDTIELTTTHRYARITATLKRTGSSVRAASAGTSASRHRSGGSSSGAPEARRQDDAKE